MKSGKLGVPAEAYLLCLSPSLDTSVTCNGAVTLIDRAFTLLTGHQQSQLQGTNIGSFIRPRLHNRVCPGSIFMTVASLQRVLPEVAQWTLSTSDGDDISVFLSVTIDNYADASYIHIFPINKVQAARRLSAASFFDSEDITNTMYDMSLIQMGIETNRNSRVVLKESTGTHQVASLLESVVGVSENGKIVWVSSDAAFMLAGLPGELSYKLLGSKISQFVPMDEHRFHKMVEADGVDLDGDQPLPPPFKISAMQTHNGTMPCLCVPLHSSSIGLDQYVVTFVKFYDFTRIERKEKNVRLIEAASGALFGLRTPGVLTAPEALLRADWSQRNVDLPSPVGTRYDPEGAIYRINAEALSLCADPEIANALPHRWVSPGMGLMFTGQGGPLDKGEVRDDTAARCYAWTDDVATVTDAADGLSVDTSRDANPMPTLDENGAEDLQLHRRMDRAGSAGSVEAGRSVPHLEMQAIVEQEPWATPRGDVSARQESPSARLPRVSFGEEAVEERADQVDEKVIQADLPEAGLPQVGKLVSIETSDGVDSLSHRTDQIKLSEEASSDLSSGQTESGGSQPVPMQHSRRRKSSVFSANDFASCITKKAMMAMGLDDAEESNTASASEGPVIELQVRHAAPDSPTPNMAGLILRNIRNEYNLLARTKARSGVIRVSMDMLARPVIAADSNGNVLCVNTMAEELFGWPQEDLQGKDVSSLMPDPLRSRHSAFVKGHCERFEATRTRRASMTMAFDRVIMDAPCLRMDGTQFKASVQLHREAPESNNPRDAVFIALVHVTEENAQIESQLEILGEQTNNVTSKAAGKFLIVEMETGRLDIVSSELADLLGYTSDELVGRHVQELYRGQSDPREDAGTGSAASGMTAYMEGRRGSPLEVLQQLTLVDDHLVIKVDVALAADSHKRRTTYILERTQTIMDNLEHGIVISDSEGRIVAANRAASSMSGHGMNELTGKNVDVLMEDAIAKDHATFMKRFMATGVRKVIGYEREFQLMKKDRSLVPIVMRLHEMVVKSHTHFFAVIIPTTSALAKYRTSAYDNYQQEFQDVVSFLQTPALVLVNNRCTMANRAALHILRMESWDYEGGVPLSKLFENTMPLEDMMRVRLGREKTTEPVLVKAIRRDGMLAPVNVRFCTWNMAASTYHLLLMSDVAIQLDQEIRIQSAGQQLKIILDNTVDGIIVANESGTILSFNRSACRMFEYPDGEVNGKSVSVIVPEPYHSVHDQFMQTYVKTGKSKILNKTRRVMGRRSNGESFNLELHISELRAGSQRFFTGVCRDVTVEAANEHRFAVTQDMSKAVMNSSDTALFEINAKCEISSHNTKAYEFIQKIWDADGKEEEKGRSVIGDDLRQYIPGVCHLIEECMQRQRDVLDLRGNSFAVSQQEASRKKRAREVVHFTVQKCGTKGRIQGFSASLNEKAHVGAVVALSVLTPKPEKVTPRQLKPTSEQDMVGMLASEIHQKQNKLPWTATESIAAAGAERMIQNRPSAQRRPSQGGGSSRPTQQMKTGRTTSRPVTRQTTARPGTRQQSTHRSDASGSSVSGQFLHDVKDRIDSEKRLDKALSRSLRGTQGSSPGVEGMFFGTSTPVELSPNLMGSPKTLAPLSHVDPMAATPLEDDIMVRSLGTDLALIEKYRNLLPEHMVFVDQMENDLNLSDAMVSSAKGKPSSRAAKSTNRSVASTSKMSRNASGMQARLSLPENLSTAGLIQKSLDGMVARMGVGFAGLFIMDDIEGFILPQVLSTGGQPEYEAFARKTGSLRFAPGVGIPGRTFSGRQPMYIPDINREINAVRQQVATECGLITGVSVPVPVGPYIEDFGREVVGIFECWMRPPDEDKLESLTDMLVLMADRMGRLLYVDRVGVSV